MDSVYTFGEREVDVPPTGEACSALVKPVTPAALTWHKPAVCALQTVDDATHARLMSQVRRREGQRKRNSKPKWMYATPLVFAPLLPMTRIALRYAGVGQRVVCGAVASRGPRRLVHAVVSPYLRVALQEQPKGAGPRFLRVDWGGVVARHIFAQLKL